jgi:septal ring factor EnvC (AmiA/AmiB activator)
VSLPESQPTALDEVPVITPATAQEEPANPEVSQAPSAPVVGRNGRSVWRRLLRALVWLAVLAAIAAAAIVGWPYVNDRVIQPISSNTTSVDALRQQLDTANSQIAQLQSEVGSITEADAGLPDRLTAIESRLEALGADDAAVATAVDALVARLDGADEYIAGHTERLAALDAAQASVGAQLTSELGVLRAMELMSRGRLFLYQANYGLAEQDIAAARAVLAGLESSEAGLAAIQRLDLAVANLPARPVLASDDLDIAWSLLLGDVALGQASGAAATEPATTGETTTTTLP